MGNHFIPFATPVSIEEAVNRLPDTEKALAWGIQSMTAETARSMILLATSYSDHYRYALAVSVGIAQYLYDMPDGAITSKNQFQRSEQTGSRIGIFDGMELHVIQEAVPEHVEEEYLMLLVLDDNHQVAGYLVSRLRLPSDHVTKTVKLASQGQTA